MEIYLYQWGVVSEGITLDKPKQETIQEFAKRKGMDAQSDTLKDDVIKNMENYLRSIFHDKPSYFVGTEREWILEKFKIQVVQPFQNIIAPFLANGMQDVKHLGLNAHNLNTADITKIIDNEGKIDLIALRKLVTDVNQPEVDRLAAIYHKYDEWLRIVDSGDYSKYQGLPSHKVDEMKKIASELIDKEREQKEIIWMAISQVPVDSNKLQEKYLTGPVSDSPVPKF